MSTSTKNKENIPERKKSSKDAKPIKSKLLLKEVFPLKNQGLQHLNRSLDLSDVTVKSPRRRQETKSSIKKIRSKITSECSLKQQQKTRKVIPILLDDSLFKRPLSQKTVKPKNSKKQSEYVSYLIQAQRKAMNSLASIDKTQLSNCHQIQKLENIKNEQIHQLRSEMQGLKHRFQRLESEHNINEKQTIITLQDVNEKDRATIDLGILGNKKIEHQTITGNPSIFKTIQIEKKIEKDVSNQYVSIIAEYEKMFSFYKQRLEVCEKDFQTEKERQKASQEQNKKLKNIIECKESDLKRKQRVFETQRNQLKEQIGVLQKSLNKKNKELLSKNEELLLKESQLKTKEQEIQSLKAKGRQSLSGIEDQKKEIIDKYMKVMHEKDVSWQKKLQEVENEKSEYEVKYNSMKEKAQKCELDLQKVKSQLQEVLQTLERQSQDSQSKIDEILLNIKSKETEWSLMQEKYANETKERQQQHLEVNNSLKKQIEELSEKSLSQSNSLQAQIKLLKEQILKLQSQISSLQVNASSHESKVSFLESELTNKQNQHTLMKSARDKEIHQKNFEIQKLKGLLNQFTLEVKQIQTQLKSNELYIQQIQNLKSNLEDQLNKQRFSLIKERQLFAQERQQLMRKQCKLEELLQEKQHEICTFSSITEKQKSESQLTITSIKDEKQTLSKQLLSLSAQVQSLQEAKQTILSQKEQLLTKVWKLNEIITANYDLSIEIKERHNSEIINKDNAVIEALREVEKIRAQKYIAEKTIEQKSSQIVILREQIISLTQQSEKKLQSIKDKHDAKLVNWKSEIETFNNLIQQKASEIHQLTQIIDSKTSELNAKDEQMAKIVEKLQDQQQKIRRLQNTISQHNQTIVSMRAQNKELSCQLETMTEELYTLTNRYEESQMTQRQQSDRKIEEINEIYQICQENKRQIIQSMRNKIDQLASEIQKSSIKIQQKDQQIALLQKQLKTIEILKNQIEQLKKKLLQSALASKGKISEMQKLQQKQEKLTTQLKNSQQYAKSLEQKITNCQTQIKQMVQKLSQKENATEKLMVELIQNREKQTGLLQKITILKEQNQQIISTYNYQLQQRKQIIQDLMREKRQLYQKLNGDVF